MAKFFMDLGYALSIDLTARDMQVNKVIVHLEKWFDTDTWNIPL